jgi:hypothetical protein
MKTIDTYILSLRLDTAVSSLGARCQRLEKLAAHAAQTVRIYKNR